MRGRRTGSFGIYWDRSGDPRSVATVGPVGIAGRPDRAASIGRALQEDVGFADGAAGLEASCTHLPAPADAAEARREQPWERME